MAKCNNNITVATLPTIENVDVNDYLIVYNNIGTSKVKFQDLVFGAENVDFYPELIQIVNSLESLSGVIDPDYNNWNSTYNTVLSNSANWTSLATGNLPVLIDELQDNYESWNDAVTLLRTTSSDWANSASTLQLKEARWDQIADIVETSRSNWDSAYAATRGGIEAIYEALAEIERQPWYTYKISSSGGSGGGGGDSSIDPLLVQSF